MRAVGQVVRRAAGLLDQFVRSKRANVAIIFALTLVPLMGAVGAGVDLSRAIVMKTRLASALDAAALAVGTSNGLSQKEIEDLAQKYFDANFPSTPLGTTDPVKVAVSGQTISLTVDSKVPTALLKMFLLNDIDLSVSNQVVRAVTKLRVALVLDNTGSMAETDAFGTSKIGALKTATHQLLTQLKDAAINPGDVQVAMIPFAKDVNAGSGNFGASWIDWTYWDTPPSGNGSWQSNKFCTGSGCTCDAYPALYDSLNNTVRSCSCSGSKSKKSCTVSTWVRSNHSTWNGCVMDRNKNYDAQNTTPGGGGTLFPAEEYGACPTSLKGLSYDWTALNSKVNAMSPSGATNQTIGLAWGWQALTQGAPLNAPAPDPMAQNVIVLLSDGLNTQNRWDGDGFNQSAAVDARMALACANAKAAKVVIYTVLVMAGNSAVLKNCASDTEKYFELTTAGQIVSAFNTIGTELANLHLSR